MIKVTINEKQQRIESLEEMDAALVRAETFLQFELWVSVPNGPLMAMLRNGPHAWLMYLRFEGDSGFVSQGDPTKAGVTSYTLGNGQVDEYPLSWCIDLEDCYKAITYFFVNDGARPEWITWHES